MTNFDYFFLKGQTLVALPGWKYPKLIVAGNKFGKRYQRSNLYPAYRVTSNVYKYILRLKAALGFSSRKSQRPAKSELQDLYQSQGQLIPATLLVGTEGPTQKNTLQLDEQEGKPCAFLKFAWKEAAVQRVEKEYNILSEIESGLGPEPIVKIDLSSGKAILLSAIPGNHLFPELPPSEDLIRWVMGWKSDKEFSIHEHPWFSVVSNAGSQHIERWKEALSDRVWPVVPVHGDFAPWNIIENKGHYSILDWEYATPYGFPYVDLAFYILQVGALIKRWGPAKAQAFSINFLTGKFSLSKPEAESIVMMTAYYAYKQARIDKHDDDEYLQRWRRTIWEDKSP